MQPFKISQSKTIRDTDSLNIYLREIAKEDLITPDEEVELARRIKEGDEKAKERLIKANTRFVISVAKQFQNKGVPLNDLVSEGNIGLIKAAEKFDETKGFKFISYAVWWIRQAIMNAISDQGGMIHLPANQVITRNKLKKEAARFEQDNQRQPTSYELAESTGIDEDKVRDSLSIVRNPTSIDAPFSEGDGEGTLLDVTVNEDSPMADAKVNKESLSQELARVLASLNENEREILKMNFGMGQPEMTLEEIGQTMGLSRERIRQIKERALRKLRSSSLNLLKNYLE